MYYHPVEDFDKNNNWSSRVIREYNSSIHPFDIEIYPALLHFGALVVGEDSAIQTVTIKNTGYKDLTIDDVVSVGSYLVTTDIPTLLKTGEYFEASVMYQPKWVGLATGGLYVVIDEAYGDRFCKFIGSGV